MREQRWIVGLVVVIVVSLYRIRGRLLLSMAEVAADKSDRVLRGAQIARIQSSQCSWLLILPLGRPADRRPAGKGRSATRIDYT